jgi:hypothetical protein
VVAPAFAFNSQQYLPWPETIVLTSVGTGSSSQTVTDAGVYPQANREDAPSNGAYTVFPIEVTIGFADVSFTPKPADTILWNANTYTLQDAHPFDYLQYYKLTALRVAIAPALAKSGTLSRPTNAKDSTGKLTNASYTTVSAGNVCAVQPLGGDATDIMQRRTMRTRFTAYLTTPVVAQAKDVFTANGQSYTVTAFSLPARIDKLMTLSLELIDSPTYIPIFPALPSITGGIVKGDTLTAVPGTVTGSPTFVYQWYSAGVAIAGATGSTYVSQTSDIGNLISVLVVATGSNGYVSRAMSNTVGPIQSSGGSGPQMFGDQMFG